jgi:hypothetical protein
MMPVGLSSCAHDLIFHNNYIRDVHRDAPSCIYSFIIYWILNSTYMVNLIQEKTPMPNFM